MHWLKRLCIVMIAVLLVGCGDEVVEDVANDAVEEVASEPTETTDEAICEEGQLYLDEEMICAPPLDCEGDDCATFGHDIVAELEDTYGSLIEEESVAVDGDLNVIATYDVNLEEELIETEADISQDDVDYHGELWFDFAWLIPEYARTDLDKFEVFESGSTLAHVYLNNPEEEIGRWTLGMNEQNIELASETMVTYIHEFAHLLSMRDEEVDYYADEASCDGRWIDELCFREDAYITHYYDTFYNEEQPETLDAFVSEYAMNSVTEDFAETFAHFVLTEQPTSTRLVDDKVTFFYQYTNLVELRADILRRAVTWLEASVVWDE